MDETQSENEKTIGSVKAAIDKYGGKITNPLKKTQKNTPHSETKAHQLHLAKKKMNQINKDREMSEEKKSKGELQLLNAKKVVRELASQIEVSKANAIEQKKELDTLDFEKMQPIKIEDGQYTEVAQQVEVVKRELSKIKLSMARLTEEKMQAEKEVEAAEMRIKSYLSSLEQLKAEIEAANEEEVLVELAQIEACKELAGIEAQRKEEGEKFSSRIEETKRKIDAFREEIEEVKDLEEKLAVTNSDVEVLQQLKLIKEMDRSVESSVKMESLSLKSESEDVEAAKNELESIKAGGFQLMTSMDVIRTELKQISEEKNKLKEKEEQTENTINNLKSKLNRMKDKLKSANASEDKAKSMLSSLSLALDNLEKEKEVAEKEREVATKETASIRTEIQKSEAEIDSTEDKLQDAMQELAEVKSAEAKALKKLKFVIEHAARTRASRNKSTITISKFEYDYLTGSAIAAQEMAGKKVEAAHAWVEALKASERELRLKVASAESKIEELSLKEEREIFALEKSLKAKEVVEGEMLNKRQGNRRRSMGEYGYPPTPVKQSKTRRSIESPATRRLTGSSSFTVKRRRKVMLKIAKYLAGKEFEDEKGGSIEKNE